MISTDMWKRLNNREFNEPRTYSANRFTSPAWAANVRRFSPDEVRHIRQMAGKVSQKQLSRKYGASMRTISDIVTRRLYRDIE